MINIRKGIADLKEDVVNLRRKIHSNPELGLNEFKTSRAIREFFRGLDVHIIDNMFKTSIIVDFKGNKSGKCYAFRADMDALPVEEKTGLEFSSREKGVMHACGHDAHMAILAGFGKYLASNREKLKHNVRLIFQPAEEAPGGALPLIKAGVLDNPEVNGIFGLHLFPDVEEGRIGMKTGPIMAQTEEIYVDVEGQSSHGAQPHKGKDALVAACNMVMAYQTIVSRSIDPMEPAVFTIGKITSGERLNIIARDARIEGTIRGFSEEDFNLIKKRAIAITRGIGEIYDCKTRVGFGNGLPAVVNDSQLFDLAMEAVGKENVDIIKPVMLAEDFAYYQKHVPGLFFMLGTRNTERGFVHPLHSCYFNFNEDVMMTGIEVFARILEKVGGIDGAN
jgi:amidohydrolase